jgi:hypothetical protein
MYTSFQHEEVTMPLATLIEELRAEDGDALLKEIHSDMQGKSSPLELMNQYLNEIRASVDSRPRAFEKLGKLFQRGRTPARLEGHFYGVTLVIRTGDLEKTFGARANLLNYLWGSLLASHPPWVGKGFTQEAPSTPGSPPVFRGTNFFRAARTSFLTAIGVRVLSLWLKLTSTTDEDRRTYGCDRTGGPFIAIRARSVAPGLEQREVFQLDYRTASLGNPSPFKYLIDELVEISDGLYLGPLLFATKRLTEKYDSSLASAEYGYTNFGYFLLMDDRWDNERRRLFPYTEDMEITKHRAIDWANTPKFTEFTFAEPPDGKCDDALLAEVKRDNEGKATVLDLIKFYVDQLGANPAPDAPGFAKLGELFNRGIAPKIMDGYLHGAVVAFRNEVYLRQFGLNAFNMLWPLVRELSPWTGKTFEPIEASKLSEITDGVEQDTNVALWGSNTYANRTDNQRPAVELMRLANLDMREASAEEARTRGYDLKSFFFIGKRGVSGNPENGNKVVYQINYRWPKLRTMPPDNYCVDELVQIAEGLYLGQLVYSTALLEQYNPARPASVYDYRNFGYFMLMDDEWYGRKLEIGFDLTPAER